MKLAISLYVAVTLLGAYTVCSAAQPACAANAGDRAKRLLIFHSGPDDRMTIEKTVKQLPSLPNPADPKQKLDVLEIWGYIYKASYRMRFIYYNSPVTSCLLMGEEILDYSRP